MFQEDILLSILCYHWLLKRRTNVITHDVKSKVLVGLIHILQNPFMGLHTVMSFILNYPRFHSCTRWRRGREEEDLCTDFLRVL